jgi:hypothetical protein
MRRKHQQSGCAQEGRRALNVPALVEMTDQGGAREASRALACAGGLSHFNARNRRGFSKSVVSWRNSLLYDHIPPPAIIALIVAQVAPITAPLGAVNALLGAYEVHTFFRAYPVGLGR